MRGKNLTEKERYLIEGYLKAGLKVKEIAKLLERAPKTIYCEIKRGTISQIDTNLKEFTCYAADAGERKAREAASNKGRPIKLRNDLEFVKFVEEQTIKKKYSPYAIAKKIENENLTFKTNVCWRTIYNYKTNGIFLNIKGRKKKRTAKSTIALHNKQGRSISERPKEVLNREQYGHWEMDTVVGGKEKGKSVLLVLTERKSLEELIFKMPDKKSASTKQILDSIEKKIGTEQFRTKFKSITVDNGVEFLGMNELEVSCFDESIRRTKIYYCHPYSSWERGSNENANKLIRRFYPKGTDFDQVSDEAIRILESWINGYPRKKHNGKSTNMILKELAVGYPTAN